MLKSGGRTGGSVALHTVSELLYTKSRNNLSDALICF